MASCRRHLTGWQPVRQCCFPSLPAVECGSIMMRFVVGNKEYYYY